LKCIAIGVVSVGRACNTNAIDAGHSLHLSVKEDSQAKGGPMAKATSEAQTRTVHDHFGRFAASASAWLGSTWAFLIAGLVITVWAATGPIFHFSDRWAQVISTATALITLLMVLLIQSTQNRDSRAINLKLNELIRAMDKARNHMIDIERLSDLELDTMQATYERIKAVSTEREK
jgi:low affinity Fe/Cu permease